MKKAKIILSLCIALAVFLTSFAIVFAAGTRGDANADSSVTSADALLVLKYSVGLDSTGIDLSLADANLDSVVNSSDALEILNICVGKTTDKSPLEYTKAEIVSYYNNSLKNSYNASNLTIAKSTDVSVTIDEISMPSLLSMANSLIEQFAVPTSETKGFENGSATDKTTAKEFLVPTDLNSDGAKSATITKTDKGYKVTITIVDEKVDHKTTPKYNAQASLPLLIDESVIKSYNASITSASLEYTGTVITAEIGEDGKLISMNHTMPLKIEGAGKYGKLVPISISGKGGGTYTLDANFTY